VRCERKRYGASWQYRLFPTNGRESVTADEIITKLGPIVRDLITEGKKHLATISPSMMAQAGVRLQKVLDEWTGSNRTARATERRLPQSPGITKVDSDV
jgi:hypothetical protein